MLHTQEIMKKQIAEGKEIDVEAVASEVVPAGTTLMQLLSVFVPMAGKVQRRGKVSDPVPFAV